MVGFFWTSSAKGDLMSNTSQSCGRTRREVLWQMGGGFVGTALTYLLARDGFFASAADAPASPLAPKSSHFDAKAKSCIFLFNYGGPSQVDLWDPKPALAKHNGQPIPILDKDPLLKVRNPGKLLASSRKFAKAGQCGLEVSDLWPHLSEYIDNIAVIRSTYADSFAHGSGMLQMNTGFLRQGYPCLGSWVTYGLGTLNQNLPGFVVMLDHRGGPISGPPNWSNGFMPATYQGTQFRTSGEPILHLTPPDGVTPEQQRQQLDLLGKINAKHAAASPDNSELAARIASYELAFRMQAHAPEAVELSQESETTRRMYGLDNPI
ncbi:MAG TPA: DUF1501 domain-containing protein, partial [Gemmataceae bacterium]|nr:DUF1501 domain-containing protein [Gemmataceae bacterium]